MRSLPPKHGDSSWGVTIKVNRWPSCVHTVLPHERTPTSRTHTQVMLEACGAESVSHINDTEEDPSFIIYIPQMRLK